jgi:PIN domain nuclease of toxin-antitoxin system
MKLLLDTHAFIWFALGDARLPAPVAAAIQSPEADVLVSAVSFYEIAFKRRRGRLSDGMPLDIAAARAMAGFVIAAITADETDFAGALPEVHRDPWDRVLVAQALRRRATLVTKDKTLSSYGVTTLW